ncbi:MAG: MarC family protein [Candidatus Bathyarchaeia archaeon]
MDYLTDLFRAIIALFIIVDPFGNIPIFLGLTQNVPEAKIKRVYNTAVLVGMILLLVFAFAGSAILTAFGLSLQSFEIAGGLLLLIIAIRILISGARENVESPESIGAVPIAIPLLVGPGAITTTMVTFQTYFKISGLEIALSIAVLAVVVVMSLTWIILRFINQIDHFLGKTGAIVIARVMALLIAGIAIQYILTGISTYPFGH